MANHNLNQQGWNFWDPGNLFGHSQDRSAIANALDPGDLFLHGHGNTAALLAGQAEGTRQRSMQNATDRINALFGAPSRQQQYQNLTNAVTQYYTDAINRQHERALRQDKFNLARSGLTGGSEQATENRMLGEDYTSALLNAARRGQQAGQALKTQDEATREALLGEVDAGLNSTAGATNAALAMRQNLANAQNGSMVNSLGDIFGNVANIYSQRQQNRAKQQGFQDALNSLFALKPGVITAFANG